MDYNNVSGSSVAPTMVSQLASHKLNFLCFNYKGYKNSTSLNIYVINIEIYSLLLSAWVGATVTISEGRAYISIYLLTDQM